MCDEFVNVTCVCVSSDAHGGAVLRLPQDEGDPGVGVTHTSVSLTQEESDYCAEVSL